MLWKQLSPRYRRLLRDGSRGEAVVVDATADRDKNSRIGGIYGWQVTIRVKFGDGSTADFDRYLEASAVVDDDGRSVLEVTAGMMLPIRFDPNDRSRVEIDTAALVEQQARAKAQEDAAQTAAVARAERELKPLDS